MARPPKILLAMVLAVLWLLAIGLPSRLVHCQTAEGSHIAIAGSCACSHQDPSPSADEANGTQVLRASRRGVHTNLAIELVPAPRPDGHAPPPPAARLAPWPAPLANATSRSASRLPAATGPPRCDARAALRAATALRL